MPPSNRKLKEKEDTGFYGAYAALAVTFRGWLVAYGIGAPVLFLSRDTVMQAIRTMSDARYVILAFLVGTILQVTLVWFCKLAMWWAYLEEMKTITKESVRYKFVDWFTNIYWIEGSVDFLTVAMFAYATGRILFVLAG